MKPNWYLRLATILYFPISKYFRFFARAILWRWRPQIIVVMGSAGKSNARNLIFEMLKKNALVRKTEKANSAFAIPLDIANIHINSYTVWEWTMAAFAIPFRTLYLLLFPYSHKYYVMELDVDRPNEMEFFASFIKPNFVFWVSSFATHTANFDKLVLKGLYKDSVQALANEFAKILDKNDKITAFLNCDSKYIRQAVKNRKIEKYCLTMDRGKYSFRSWQIFRKRTVYTLQIDKQKFEIELPFIAPKNFGYTLLAMYILAKLLHFDTNKISLVTDEFRFSPSVCSILNGYNNSKIIDSSYNSSFYATTSLLQVLKNYPGRRKIAVLGDMRELGKLSGPQHENLAKRLLKYQFDQVVLVGPLMQRYVYPLLSRSYADTNLHWFGNSYQAGLFIKERLLKPQDVVLLKASQNTLFFELIAELILKDPEDTKLLCRRAPVWEQKRLIIKNDFYKTLNNLKK